jgi:hypothetical protein
MVQSEPVLVDVLPAIEALPRMTGGTILTSGPPLPWSSYVGGQRDAVIGGALYEGLAEDRDDAIRKLDRGEIRVEGCQDHGAVGSVAGIYTASMPVFVVDNAPFGTRAFCNMYEGRSPKRLNYGVYDETVRAQLEMLAKVLGPVIGEAVRSRGGIPLKPIIVRALNMGDELHSRNTAASLLFARELFPAFLAMYGRKAKQVDRALETLTEDHYFFLRLSMAAAKVSADAAHGVEYSSLVTAMGFSCREFGIRVSGLDGWFRGPHPSVDAKLFEGHTADEITWMGGESPITETVGLGGFAQASAPALQAYQGGSYEAMIERNKLLYAITVGENPEFKIPALGYRGTPTGVDVFRVLDQGVLPVMDIGVPGVGGGQIGAGIVSAPVECFAKAAAGYRARYE